MMGRLLLCFVGQLRGEGICFRLHDLHEYVIRNWFKVNYNYKDRKPLSKQETEPLNRVFNHTRAVWCSPFCRLPCEASNELLLKLMFVVSQLPFPAALWSTSVCAPTHAADADVSFRAQSSMIELKIMGLVSSWVTQSLTRAFRQFSPEPLTGRQYCSPSPWSLLTGFPLENTKEFK